MTAATQGLAGARHPQQEFKSGHRVGPVGIAVMLGLHVIVGYLLVSGLGKQIVEVVKKPLDATIIDEVKLPPPPPPLPPKPVVQQAVVKVDVAPPPAYVPPPETVRPNDAPSPIAAVQSVDTAPPPAAVPPVPVPVAAPAAVASAKAPSSEIGVVCPTQVKPVPPQKALDDGITGTVKAEVRIRAGKVVDVRILSGPKPFYAAVRTAVLKYECIATGAEEVTARQEFEFKLE